ncbi:hypothetical protein EWM64_g8125 [Hericium alpestre]|uniref:F-box domain-containing protein n=1 Tax=Hericium alpestre TaxID=135208 RepID=A0A4Y9ZPB0_9AGAM|nr:hypothetical protein EWM64_g8125 [Hericium alpestre]
MAFIAPNETNRDPSNADNYWSDAVRPRIALLQTGFYPRGPEAANAFQEAIDAELTAMCTAITTVKSMRNTQAAIRRLPPEVLTRIFWFCSVQEAPSRYSNRMRYGASDLWQQWEPGWMKVTYVCRYWRDAALQDPRLWGSNVACDLPFRWIEETLNRSKLAPASIPSQSTLSQSPDFIHLLAKHLHHIRHLALRSDYGGDLSPVVEALVDRAPVLETFRLQQYTGTTKPLPDDIFARYAPRLRRIVLLNWFLPMAACPEMVSRVEHLDMFVSSDEKFHDSFYASEHCLFYNQTFSTLQQMTTLRTLKLKMSLPPCSAGVFTRDYALSLPHLEELELVDTAAETALFLEHLHIPATTRLKVKAYRSSFDEVYILLAPQLHRRLQAAPTPAQALSISCDADHHDISIKVKAWSSVPSNESEGNATLDFEFDGLGGTGQNAGIACALHQLCSTLSVDAVSWLYCQLRPVADWNRQQLVELFTGFPMLESLTLHGLTGKRLAMFLASPIPNKKLSANTALLQRLCELTLKDFDFGLPHTKSRTAKTGKCEYIPLLEALRKRKAALGRIPKLVMMSCYMTEEWAEEMRQDIELEWVPL